MAAWFDGLSMTFEVGFASNPTVAVGSTTWTDVTVYVRSADWRWGTTPDTPQQVQPGTATLVLDNRDRRFDPDHTGGPYYPNVLPMRRLRIRGVYNSVTYDLWSGFIETWPQVYDQPNDAFVTIDAVDALAVLGSYEFDSDTYKEMVYTQTISPIIYCRGGAIDPQGNPFLLAGKTVQWDSESVPPLQTRGASVVAGALPATDDGALSVSAAGIDTLAPTVTINGGANETAISVCGWFMVTQPMESLAESEQICLAGWMPNAPYAWYLATTWPGPGATQFQMRVIASTYQQTEYINLEPNVWHWFIIRINAGAPYLFVHVDAYQLSTFSGGIGAYQHAKTTVQLSGAVTTLNGYEVRADEIAVYGYDANYYDLETIRTEAIASPHIGETPGARIGYILNRLGWPFADRDIDSGSQQMGPLYAMVADAVTHLRKVTDSEQGWFLMGPDGKAVFRSRSRLYAPPLAIFGDGAGELAYHNISPELTTADVVNHALMTNEVTRTTSEQNDLTSQGKYMKRTTSIMVNSPTDEYGAALGAEIINRHKNPVSRIPSLEIKPRWSMTTLAPQVLGRRFGDVIEVRRRPQGIGSAIDKNAMIIGAQHKIDPDGEWSCRWFLLGQPVGPWLTLGDATFGRIGAAAGNKIPY